MAKVWVDQDKCASARVCTGLAPEIFELNDNNKAYVKGDNENLTGEKLEKAKKAADSCPMQAINVEE